MTTTLIPIPAKLLLKQTEHKVLNDFLDRALGADWRDQYGDGKNGEGMYFAHVRFNLLLKYAPTYHYGDRTILGIKMAVTGPSGNLVVRKVMTKNGTISMEELKAKAGELLEIYKQTQISRNAEIEDMQRRDGIRADMLKKVGLDPDKSIEGLQLRIAEGDVAVVTFRVGLKTAEALLETARKEKAGA